MDEFLKMDIFFFVTTVVVVVIGIVATFVLWRVERILKQVEYISTQVAGESDNVRRDLAEMRGDIQRGKGRFMSLFGFLKKSAKRATKDS